MRSSDLVAEVESARRTMRLLGLVVVALLLWTVVAGGLLIASSLSSAAEANTETNTAGPAR